MTDTIMDKEKKLKAAMEAARLFLDRGELLLAYAALERLIARIKETHNLVLGNSDGPAVLEGREPAFVAGEPSDEEFRQLYCDIFDLRCDPASLGPVPVKFARAVLARWGHQPARPAEGDGPRLYWTENMPPSESCRYDHCIAETPFGRFLITWKSWKEYDSPTVDETPWGDWYVAFNSIDAAKAACQQEFNKRLARCGHQPTLSADDIPPAVTISALLRPAYEPGDGSADCAVGYCSWDGWKEWKLPSAMQVVASLAASLTGGDIMKPRGGYINRHKCVYENCPFYKPLKRSSTTLIT